jgi:hypothetical protein
MSRKNKNSEQSSVFTMIGALRQLRQSMENGIAFTGQQLVKKSENNSWEKMSA